MDKVRKEEGIEEEIQLQYGENRFSFEAKDKLYRMSMLNKHMVEFKVFAVGESTPESEDSVTCQDITDDIVNKYSSSSSSEEELDEEAKLEKRIDELERTPKKTKKQKQELANLKQQLAALIRKRKQAERDAAEAAEAAEAASGKPRN